MPSVQHSFAWPRRPQLQTSPLDKALVFGHGLFQRLLLFCATLSLVVGVVHSFAIAVLARPVDHWCKPPPGMDAESTDIWKNHSLPVESDGTFSRCTRYVTFPETGNVTRNRTVMACDQWDFDPKTQSIVSEWNLVCNRAWLLPFQRVTYFASSIVAALTGYMADRFGRRPVLIAALSVLIVSGTATIFSHTLAMFTALRCLVSASSITMLTLTTVVLFEMTETSHRIGYCIFAISSTLVLTPLLMFLLLVLTSNWVVAQAALMVPTSILIVAVYAVDESPCWLLAARDLENTQRVALWAAYLNGVPLDGVRVKMRKIKQELLRRGTVQTDADRTSALDLVLNASLRYRAITILACWFVVVLNFYDINQNHALTESSTVVAINIALKFLVPFTTALILNQLGRRRALFATMVVDSLLVAFQACLVLQRDESFLTPAMVVTTACVLDMSCITLYVYSPEIFPTVLRSMGMSLCITFGRLGSMLWPIMMGSGLQLDLHIKLFASSGSLMFFALAAYMLPETTRATNTTREIELEDKWNCPTSQWRTGELSRSLNFSSPERYSRRLDSRSRSNVR